MTGRGGTNLYGSIARRTAGGSFVRSREMKSEIRGKEGDAKWLEENQSQQP